ncbi:beta-propeller domain-containing protein [Candidatus Bathyarchaeota archaeon]|nr:beta-propeller domain-containing protein [Candidatus Bathyarchaeota archaeon]
MQREIKKRAGLYGAAAVLLALVLGSMFYSVSIIPQQIQSPPQPSLFKTFSSAEEIKSYLTANSRTYAPFLFVGPADANFGQVRTMMESSQNSFATAPGLTQEPTYSTTNIQVSGVDEADIVKTDGKYLYVMSGTNVFILKAYPSEEAEIVSKIAFNDTNLVGIFVSGSSNRLAVLGSKYKFPEFYFRQFAGSVIVDVKTFLNVYDISNKSAPSFLTNFTITGSYFSSRMIGDYVYFVVSQPAYIILETVILPKIITNDGIKEIPASEVFYSEASDNYFMYTTVVAMNIATAEEPAYKTLMLGGTSSMYVSPNNIYITFPEPYEKTAVYRIRIENSTISPEAKGKVPGRELNQFSMDEYGDHFRIATTTRINWAAASNNLYILNMNLSILGKLENIAPNENLDSARFIGNRCYLSTSVIRIDPFFVIDVENATKPKILGYLKIPGFMRYLHPYDENHIIGVGRDENNSVKISIFDVTNVSAPIEIDMYSVPGDWSDSTVLTDHKAFLFEKSRDLLAIPVSAYYWDKYWQWQGLYVFNITLSNGIVLRGNVTHLEDTAYYWNCQVKRALYIDNVLYTVSDIKVKLNRLEDLAFIKEILLP